MSRVEPNRNVYVGHRYVPKIFGEWDKQNEYEGLSIVTHQGASFTSKQRVPVGIDILNEEFWVITGNYNSQVEGYRQDVNNVRNDFIQFKTDANELISDYKSDNDSMINDLQTSLDNKINHLFINPVSFGLDENASDNSTALENTLNAIKDTGGTVLFPENRVYRFTRVLTPFTQDNITIDLNGSTLDFSQANNNIGETLIQFTGNYLNDLFLTSDTTADSKTVNVTTNGLKKGDFIKIKSNGIWDKDRTSSVIGEINEIDYIISPTQLSLKKPLQSIYKTSDNAQLNKVEMLKNITIKNGTIDAGFSNNQFIGLDMTLCYNLQINNMTTKGIDKRHMFLSDTIYSNVNNNIIETSHHENQGYGVSVGNASSDINISNNHFDSVRHSMSTNNAASVGGIVRRIIFEGNTVSNSTVNLTNGGGGDAIDTHAGAEDISIINNIVNGSSGYGINFEARSGIIEGNRIINCEGGGIHVNPWADLKSSVSIVNNNISDVYSYGIAYVTRPANADNVIITGNNVKSRSDGIRVQALSNSLINGLSISNNVVDNNINNTIRLEKVSNFTITGNSLLSSLTSIMMINCNTGAINGNTLLLTTVTFSSLWGMRLDNTSKVIMTGNSVKYTNTDPTVKGTHAFSLTGESNQNGVFNNLVENFGVTAYFPNNTTGNLNENNMSI